METLYKNKRKLGLGNIEKRKELNKYCSKAKKDEIIASRRRMPLGELNVSCTSKSPLMKSSKSVVKKADRLQLLREWQKARKEAKARELPKKPIFSMGKSKEVNFRPQIKISIKKPHGAVTSAAKKAILNLSPSKRLARPLHISTTTCKAVIPPSRKPSPHPVTNKEIVKMSNKKIPAKQTASHSEAPKSGHSQSTVKEASNYRKVEGYNNRSCRNVAAKNIASATTVTVAPCSRAPPASRVAPKAGKCAMQMGNKQRKKRATPVKTRRQKRNEKVNPCEPPAIPKVPVLSSSSQSPSLCVVTEKEDSLVISIPPTTPIKKNYAPVCPSPLLSSHSADYEQHQKTKCNHHPTFADESAWIPGASVLDTVSDNFGDFSNKFSPFKFGTNNAGSTPFHFRFAIDTGLPPEPVTCKLFDNGMTSSETTITTTDATEESTSEEQHCILIEAEEDTAMSTTEEVRKESIDKAEMMDDTPSRVHSARKRATNSHGSAKYCQSRIVVKGEEEETTSVVANLAVLLVEESNEEQLSGLDIPYFRKLYSDTCNKLTSLSETWEEKTAALEATNEPDMEEVLGQLRTTTGQARLLMRQKLKQYIGLVDKAEKTENGDRKTTANDLQGFWDMVDYQVQSLYKMFTDIEELEMNDWRLPCPSPKKLKLQKKKRGFNKMIKKTENESGNERLLAARKKREEDRAQLKELKAKTRHANADEVGKENQQQPSNEEESSKKCANEDCEYVTQSPLRRSMRIKNRSISPRSLRGQEDLTPSLLMRSKQIKNRSVFSPICQSTDAKTGGCRTRRRLRELEDGNDVVTGVLVDL